MVLMTKNLPGWFDKTLESGIMTVPIFFEQAY